MASDTELPFSDHGRQFVMRIIADLRRHPAACSVAAGATRFGIATSPRLGDLMAGLFGKISTTSVWHLISAFDCSMDSFCEAVTGAAGKAGRHRHDVVGEKDWIQSCGGVR